MSRYKIYIALFCLVTTALCCQTGCSKVPAGHVGVKVYLLGGEKGVDNEVLGVGRYWIGWNEELFLFPTFQQTKAWTKNETKDSPEDQSFVFQTKEGLSVGADVSISYTIRADKVATLFQRYRKGVDEITDVYLRNLVRDALVLASSTRTVEAIYGEGKSDLIEEVKRIVQQKIQPIGIDIDMISFIGDLRLPENVVESINAKIAATQKAQQRENELREAEAQANKRIAEARGIAESTKIQAQAQAEANKEIAKSLTPELVEYLKAQKWDGKLPQVSGNGGFLLSVPSK